MVSTPLPKDATGTECATACAHLWQRLTARSHQGSSHGGRLDHVLEVAPAATEGAPHGRIEVVDRTELVEPDDPIGPVESVVHEVDPDGVVNEKPVSAGQMVLDPGLGLGCWCDLVRGHLGPQA